VGSNLQDREHSAGYARNPIEKATASPARGEAVFTTESTESTETEGEGSSSDSGSGNLLHPASAPSALSVVKKSGWICALIDVFKT
jgi:hypothetical protein